MKNLLETLNYQPVQLFDDDVTSPEPSITSFFRNHPLHVTRATIAEFYACWIAQNEDNLEGTNLSLTEMMAFVNDLIHLVNLSYVVGHNYQAVVLPLQPNVAAKGESIIA
jgi:hypothetical protein